MKTYGPLPARGQQIVDFPLLFTYPFAFFSLVRQLEMEQLFFRLLFFFFSILFHAFITYFYIKFCCPS